MLAQVAEAHDGSQQDGQGQCHRNESEGGMEEEFHDNLERQAFTYQVVHINPQELHQQHKDHDEKRE